METKRTSRACCTAPHVLPQLLPALSVHACGGRSGDSANNLWNVGFFLRRTFIRCLLGDILCGCCSGSCAMRAARSSARTTQQRYARGCATPHSRWLRLPQNAEKWRKIAVILTSLPFPPSLTHTSPSHYGHVRCEHHHSVGTSQPAARGALRHLAGSKPPHRVAGNPAPPTARWPCTDRLTEAPPSRPASPRSEVPSAAPAWCSAGPSAGLSRLRLRAALFRCVCVFAGVRGAEPGPWRTAARSGPMAAS